jgi:kynurenine formamidase
MNANAELNKLVGQARVVDLAHALEVGMPQSPNHPPFRMRLENRHGDVVNMLGGSMANEIIITGGHVGTHMDALGHVSQDGLLHDCVVAADVQSFRGLSRHGIESFTPYVGRAVLLDVAALHGVAVLPPGYEVTAADLTAASERADVTVEPGDAVLIRTGWSAHWGDPELFAGQRLGAPGPGVEAGEWLASQSPTVVCGETIAFECIPPGAGHSRLPVHRLILVDAGVYIVEAMRMDELAQLGATEFTVILNPLLVLFATGAPMRPLALLSPTES